MGGSTTTKNTNSAAKTTATIRATNPAQVSDGSEGLCDAHNSKSRANRGDCVKRSWSWISSKGGRLAIAPGMPGGKMKEAAAMAQRIYIIEDDVALRTELAHVLELSGFAVGAYEGSWAGSYERLPKEKEDGFTEIH